MASRTGASVWVSTSLTTTVGTDRTGSSAPGIRPVLRKPATARGRTGRIGKRIPGTSENPAPSAVSGHGVFLPGHVKHGCARGMHQRQTFPGVVEAPGIHAGERDAGVCVGECRRVGGQHGEGARRKPCSAGKREANAVGEGKAAEILSTGPTFFSSMNSRSSLRNVSVSGGWYITSVTNTSCQVWMLRNSLPR